jgi:hypothetical protein
MLRLTCHALWSLAELPRRDTAMRKIRLKIDDLSVDSFNTSGGEGKKVGTVRGYDWSEFEGCSEFDGCNSQYSNCATCMYGCPQPSVTCFASCLMTGGAGPCIDPNC